MFCPLIPQLGKNDKLDMVVVCAASNLSVWESGGNEPQDLLAYLVRPVRAVSQKIIK